MKSIIGELEQLVNAIRKSETEMDEAAEELEKLISQTHYLSPDQIKRTRTLRHTIEERGTGLYDVLLQKLDLRREKDIGKISRYIDSIEFYIAEVKEGAEPITDEASAERMRLLHASLEIANQWGDDTLTKKIENTMAFPEIYPYFKELHLDEKYFAKEDLAGKSLTARISTPGWLFIPGSILLGAIITGLISPSPNNLKKSQVQQTYQTVEHASKLKKKTSARQILAGNMKQEDERDMIEKIYPPSQNLLPEGIKKLYLNYFLADRSVVESFLADAKGWFTIERFTYSIVNVQQLKPGKPYKVFSRENWPTKLYHNGNFVEHIDHDEQPLAVSPNEDKICFLNLTRESYQYFKYRDKRYTNKSKKEKELNILYPDGRIENIGYFPCDEVRVRWKDNNTLNVDTGSCSSIFSTDNGEFHVR